MKKIALTLTAVAAVTVFAPEASALPVFARQTGMACSACHFQRFPLLNGFGRAFKAAGYTMMGAQGKVEGEHLDIPDRLNMAGLTSVYYQKQSGDVKTQPQWGVPSSGGELSLFYGGRVSEFAGFLSELGATGTAGAAATNSAKLVLLFPVGDARVGFTSYSTGGAGAAYGFEYLNTGAVDNHKMTDNPGPKRQYTGATYAGSYMGTNTAATGVSLVANNSMGFVNIGQFAAAGPGTATAYALPITYIRAVGTFDVAGFETAVGVQSYSGDMGGYANIASYEASIIDAQAQGEVAGMSTGFYATYGMAPAKSNGNALSATGSTLAQQVTAANLGNVNVSSSTLNLAASLEVIPHTATVHGGLRFANLSNGNAGTVVAGNDNAFLLGGTYELAQNIGLGLDGVMQYGSAWDKYKTISGSDAVGKTAFTLSMYVVF
ncbi:MAG: hypothetical protein EPO42_03455 [Gallionellaceae bacterium]|nr:MAG: hypothetical protein EPO42_03455 [Gallionellaceae bacterium]